MAERVEGECPVGNHLMPIAEPWKAQGMEGTTCPKSGVRNSLTVQCLGLSAFTAWAQVQFLVRRTKIQKGELCGQKQNKNKQQKVRCGGDRKQRAVISWRSRLRLAILALAACASLTWIEPRSSTLEILEKLSFGHQAQWRRWGGEMPLKQTERQSSYWAVIPTALFPHRVPVILGSWFSITPNRKLENSSLGSHPTQERRPTDSSPCGSPSATI